MRVAGMVQSLIWPVRWQFLCLWGCYGGGGGKSGTKGLGKCHTCPRAVCRPLDRATPHRLGFAMLFEAPVMPSALHDVSPAPPLCLLLSVRNRGGAAVAGCGQAGMLAAEESTGRRRA